MTRAFAPPGPAPSVRRAATPRRARDVQSLARAATGLACGALADAGEMLVVSLLTAGAAAAAACALASLVLWIAKALAAVVARGPARAWRRLPVIQARGIASEHAARMLPASEGIARRSASSNNGQPEPRR